MRDDQHERSGREAAASQGSAVSDALRIEQLESELQELHCANRILTSVAAYFARNGTRVNGQNGDQGISAGPWGER